MPPRREKVTKMSRTFSGFPAQRFIPSFVRKLASRGLQPDHRPTEQVPAKASSSEANMASYTSSPPPPDAPVGVQQPHKDAWKNHAHRLPHISFDKVEEPTTVKSCTACDDPNPLELHKCRKCELTLCGVCQYMITDHLVRGDLKCLISNVARWKLGYSKEFLEREKAETTQSRSNSQAEDERTDEEEIFAESQQDIDNLYQRVSGAFV